MPAWLSLPLPLEGDPLLFMEKLVLANYFAQPDPVPVTAVQDRVGQPLCQADIAARAVALRGAPPHPVKEAVI
ncbi:hypothetical protein [Nonomuraea sp. NPDC049158]|uniref:hypothetical protein n=1 Tax=Nonomuraea sp. NPDC049158 TaxID=3155649 RepID=UPI0033F4E296